MSLIHDDTFEYAPYYNHGKLTCILFICNLSRRTISTIQKPTIITPARKLTHVTSLTHGDECTFKLIVLSAYSSLYVLPLCYRAFWHFVWEKTIINVMMEMHVWTMHIIHYSKCGVSLDARNHSMAKCQKVGVARKITFKMSSFWTIHGLLKLKALRLHQKSSYTDWLSDKVHGIIRTTVFSQWQRTPKRSNFFNLPDEVNQVHWRQNWAISICLYTVQLIQKKKKAQIPGLVLILYLWLDLWFG